MSGRRDAGMAAGGVSPGVRRGSLANKSSTAAHRPAAHAGPGPGHRVEVQQNLHVTSLVMLAQQSFARGEPPLCAY